MTKPPTLLAGWEDKTLSAVIDDGLEITYKYYFNFHRMYAEVASFTSHLKDAWFGCDAAYFKFHDH